MMLETYMEVRRLEALMKEVEGGGGGGGGSGGGPAEGGAEAAVLDAREYDMLLSEMTFISQRSAVRCFVSALVLIEDGSLLFSFHHCPPTVAVWTDFRWVHAKRGGGGGGATGGRHGSGGGVFVGGSGAPVADCAGAGRGAVDAGADHGVCIQGPGGDDLLLCDRGRGGACVRVCACVCAWF